MVGYSSRPGDRLRITPFKYAKGILCKRQPHQVFGMWNYVDCLACHFMGSLGLSISPLCNNIQYYQQRMVSIRILGSLFFILVYFPRAFLFMEIVVQTIPKSVQVEWDVELPAKGTLLSTGGQNHILVLSRHS